MPATDDDCSLVSLGWDADRAAELAALPGAGLLRAGRVVRVDRGLCRVLGADGVLRASFGSRVLEAMAADAQQTPCTGDWCGVRVWPDGPVTVEAVLSRRSSVVRAEVRGTSRGQVLAANLDVAAVVAGLVPEPAMSRLERLVALGWSSGATPVVVLTKADLVGDAEHIAADVAAAAPGVRVLVCSVPTGQGMAELRALVGSGRTMGLLGSSGAGKSTLVNALVGAQVLTTAQIRADGRGRHTSARRELVPLPGGGCLIDTPGLRGVGLIDAEEGVSATFGDVESLVARCRFRDCSHTTEPGCAVLAAVDRGELAVRRLERWRKLQRELAWMAARSDARLRAERGRAWRQRARARRRESR